MDKSKDKHPAEHFSNSPASGNPIEPQVEKLTQTLQQVSDLVQSLKRDNTGLRLEAEHLQSKLQTAEDKVLIKEEEVMKLTQQLEQLQLTHARLKANSIRISETEKLALREKLLRLLQKVDAELEAL